MEKFLKDIEEVEKWVEKERKTLENEDLEKNKKASEKKKKTFKDAVLESRARMQKKPATLSDKVGKTVDILNFLYFFIGVVVILVILFALGILG